jgi:DNA-binding response OmpR family regulator
MAEQVLMIEDDAELSAMVSEYLGTFGIKVTTRTTARRAAHAPPSDA